MNKSELGKYIEKVIYIALSVLLEQLAWSYSDYFQDVKKKKAKDLGYCRVR